MTRRLQLGHSSALVDIGRNSDDTSRVPSQFPGNLGAMTIPSEHMNPPAQPEDADTSLLPPEARATVAEIKAENAALEMDDHIAEVEAEAIEEEAAAEAGAGPEDDPKA